MRRLVLRLSLFYMTVLGFAALPRVALAKTDMVRQIPDEYETTSGHGIGLNNAGFAANDGYSAIRANPALLAAQRIYAVSAGYNWPSAGRDYFQAGVVDSKTSSIAAGVSYTGYTDNYVYSHDQEKGNTGASPFDSPIIRRGLIGAAQNFGSVSVGIGATYVEAHPLAGTDEFARGDKNVKGIGVNGGIAAAVAPGWSVGGSIENASNQKIKEYAPRTVRAGVAWQAMSNLLIMLDGRQRDRVAAFEDPVDPDHPDEHDPLMKQPERMVLGSFSAMVQDYLRLMGSYGQSTTDDRRSVAGGIAVVNKNFSLSYTAERPYMRLSAAHQAVTLSFDMAM